jgi:ubiquinol-cytochrome c reductase cytochrome c subunit
VTTTADKTTAGSGRGQRLQVALTVVALALVLVAMATITGESSTASAAQPTAQEDAAAGAGVYSVNCASCHQADGLGIPGSFPPLVGNPKAADADYVEGVVRGGLSGPIEVNGETFDGTMQAFDALPDADIAAVVAYVGELSGRDPDATPTTVPVVVEPGDIDEGRDLFIGSTRFDEGGAACASCHVAGNVGNLGGWSLGPDLTNSHETFGGEAGLSGWLSNPASATMQPIFSDDPLTAPEIADVVAFLGDAPSQSKPSDPGDGLILAGAAGFMVLIGGMAFAWRGMRQTYVERLRSKR